MIYKLNLNEIEFHIVGRTNENPPWRHNGRKTDYNHIIVIISGTCILRMENKTYTLRPQDMVLIPKNSFYCLETTTHCEYYFMCFYADCVEANENDLKMCSSVLRKPDKHFFLPMCDDKIVCIDNYITLDIKLYSTVSRNFIKMMQLNFSRKYLEHLMIDVYGKEILLLTSYHLFFNIKNDAIHSNTLEKITAYIDENYTEHITPEVLSDIFKLSKEHICLLFSSKLGMTVNEYVTSVKIQHATELLSNSSMNISQIAEYLGFSSLHYFSRTFKKFYGVPPTKFSTSGIGTK